MKNYKSYPVVNLGMSDSAYLTIVGYADGKKVDKLYFGEDGCYSAYVVDELAKIGEHYTLTSSYSRYLVVIDDEGDTTVFKGKSINIYRAGDFGCIIQVVERCKEEVGQ